MENNVTISTQLSEASLSAIEQIVDKLLKARLSEQRQAALLSPAEACKLFQPAISVRTLTRWTQDGHIKDHRIGGRIWYKYDEVVESAKRLKKFNVR
jgi:hypothetical protein